MEAVKQASPHLWAAAQQKVQAEINLAHMWIVVLTSLIILTWVAVATIMKWCYDNDVQALAWIVTGVSDIFFVVSLCCNIHNYILFTTARDWYIIKFLVELSPLK